MAESLRSLSFETLSYTAIVMGRCVVYYQALEFSYRHLILDIVLFGWIEVITVAYRRVLKTVSIAPSLIDSRL